MGEQDEPVAPTADAHTAARCERDRADLFEQLPIACFMLGRDGLIRRANPAGAALLGLADTSVSGVAFTEHVDRFDRPAWQGLLARCFTASGPQACELTLARGTDLRMVRLDGQARPGADECQLLVSDITAQRLASDALLRSETRLRAAYRRLAQTQEAERLRLTEQLHDQVGRNLTALGLNLSMLQRELVASAAPTQARLQDSIVLLRTTVGQVRGLMSELYPPMLGDFGLFAALRWWVGEMKGRTTAAIRLLPVEAPRRRSGEVESGLFRIAQEALANAIRHAGAGRIELGLVDDGEQLVMWIDDDGRGFDPAAGSTDEERPSWGLMWMRERALAIGATLELDACVGGGTRVRVQMGRQPA